MFAPDTYSIITRGLRITLRCPTTYTYVYLLHFNKPYHHAKHYLGVTSNLEARLKLHKSGNGARLMEVVSEAGIGFVVARLWKTDSWEEGHTLERRLKRRHEGPRLCPLCRQKPVDAYALLYQGHWPFHVFAQVGKRQPMCRDAPCFVR